MQAAGGGRERTPVAEDLYRLTNRLFRAGTPNDVYEAALDTITRGLGCSRAAILLCDDAGTMRFAAWRGLSDGYRRAVQGHSPWRRDDKDPQPVCIQDIEATNLPEFLHDIIEAERIGALAFFPLLANGALVGKVMTYYDSPHAFSDAELALALTVARRIGFNLESARAQEALRESQRQLLAELAATQQLHRISTQLIHASDPEALYEKILDAAVAIMRSDFASMQMFYPQRGELRLLAHRGFDPAAAAFWEWVQPESRCTCGAALAAGTRSIVPDIESSDFMAGSEELEAFRQTGIRAMQSTPLVSRTGRTLGMISTHWRNPHQPSERNLRLLDVVARQAADLIERKQTELTDQRLAAIVDSSHDAIVSKDLNGFVTTWNRGAERVFGYAASEMIGRSVTTLIPPDRHHEEDRILDRIRCGERVDPYETVRKHRDGSLLDVSISVSPLRNAAGEVIGASKIARDIAERKKAELALAERNIQLALAGKVGLVGSWAYDADTEIMRISEGYAAIHGFPEGTVEIPRSECLATVHSDDVGRVEQIRNEAFHGCRHEYNVEYRIIRAGEVRWVETRCFISYNGEGRPHRVVGVSIDMTERKRVEEQQRILSAELDHRVKNVLATVSAIAAHTKGASNSMEDFVAALDSRIQSMASTHELLSGSRWEGVPLRELVRRELAPYTSNDNTCTEGPEVVLKAEAAQTTASVLHELTTNAAKYGALSKPEGRVSIRWHRARNGQTAGALVLEWIETGGPPVKVPSASGFGRTVITELLRYELGGTADLAFSPEGVRCRLDVPAKWLAPAANAARSTLRSKDGGVPHGRQSSPRCEPRGSVVSKRRSTK
jgi:PAS domain S-box-containing protein